MTGQAIVHYKNVVIKWPTRGLLCILIPGTYVIIVVWWVLYYEPLWWNKYSCYAMASVCNANNLNFCIRNWGSGHTTCGVSHHCYRPGGAGSLRGPVMQALEAPFRTRLLHSNSLHPWYSFAKSCSMCLCYLSWKRRSKGKRFLVPQRDEQLVCYCTCRLAL